MVIHRFSVIAFEQTELRHYLRIHIMGTERSGEHGKHNKISVTFNPFILQNHLFRESDAINVCISGLGRFAILRRYNVTERKERKEKKKKKEKDEKLTIAAPGGSYGTTDNTDLKISYVHGNQSSKELETRLRDFCECES